MIALWRLPVLVWLLALVVILSLPFPW